MASRIQIFDHSGNYLAEVDATFYREYKINEWGIGRFTLSTSDAKCREDYLQFGNFVYIVHEDNKVPPWGGMIDTPRKWGNGSVESTCYSGEYILTFMLTEGLFIENVPGAIFQELIEQVDRRDIGGMVRIGSIFGGGKSCKREYNYEIIYDAAKTLSEKKVMDWDMTPELDDNGRLYFTANWYEKKGMKRNFTFYEDKHIKMVGVPLREQGRISNNLYVLGDNSTFESKPVAYEFDSDSMNLYGERWYSESRIAHTTAEDTADKLLGEYSYPRKTYDVTVEDVGNAFVNCGVGDQIPVEFYTVGFNGSGFGSVSIIRIMQMKYYEEKNELKIVADEEIE